MRINQQERFINLLKEIFQFEQADLDFGIYKIMNQKREEVSEYLSNELVPQVEKAFKEYRNSDTEIIKEEIETLEKQLIEIGVAKESSEKYVALQNKIKENDNLEELENDVYSQLTNFFKRYYYEGDFVSMRRYKKDVYAIPYEGEEVKLHWANSDQYYIKTTEYFKNYSFKLNAGKTVKFLLVDASTEKNNNKESVNKERKFVLYDEEPIKEYPNELNIKFEYRLTGNKKKQKQLNEETLDKLLSYNYNYDWYDELNILSPTEKNKKRTLLEKYLNDYTARNTFDYFIHKDLGGFLRRELDFFIKNDIMHLDDLDTVHEIEVQKYLSKLKVIKSIGNKIITLLEQIENFQKKLWLKKKFVLETNYCLTLDKIPEKLYIDIINNESQLDEWRQLFDIESINNNKSISVDFLKDNKFLILDTVFFNKEFTDELLSSFDDLDNHIDGTIIHSENFQALNLMQEKLNSEIDYIYIDPPYNAQSSEILYKNTFKHSSWLSLMENRIKLSRKLLKKDGVFTCAIDEVEQERLGMLLNDLFEDSFVKECVTIVHNPSGQQGDNFSATHEYAYFVYDTPGRKIGEQYRENEKEWDERNFRDVTGADSLREAGPNCFYPIYVKNNKVVGFGEISDKSYHPKVNEEVSDDMIAVYPVDPKGIERKWRFARETVGTIQDQLNVHYLKNRNVFDIKRLKKHFNYKTVWSDARYSANNHGTQLLNDIIPNAPFSYPKSLYTVKDSITAGLNHNKNGIVLDFFGGSGTTAHAIIDLNREDQGERKYILVEMGEYFDSVTKPRLKKIIYSKDWSKGRPVSRKGISHMFKYFKLESYEDSLNNIKINRTINQQTTLDNIMSDEAREEYMIKYMLNEETKNSPSLLNISSFNNPFEYSLSITDGNEIRNSKVDLIETFNYLIGIRIRNVRMVDGIKVITGQVKDDKEILILWRNLEITTNNKLEEVFRNQIEKIKSDDLSTIYVNGDNHLENLKSLRDKWSVVLIEEEFKRLMLEVGDV